MRELFAQLLQHLESGGSAAYCRLVETRGSTPQKPGAMMLVFPDGSQAGTLGGGCVEAEVKRRALTVLQKERAEIATFQLNSDYGWDDGLICGGRMKVLIEPLRPDSSCEYLKMLASSVQTGAGVTEAIVFERDAVELDEPEYCLFDEHQKLVACWRADQTSAETLVASLRSLDQRPQPYVQHGAAFLPWLRRCRLLIVGGGHVGRAVADMAADLDFAVWVVDDRESIVSEERFPKAQQRIAGGVDDVLPNLEITSDTYCLIVTRGHNHDERALYYLADRGARYVGLIGSRRKIKMIFDDLLEEGVSAEALRRVHAPVGLDIGSQTVPEIAVSIAAELVAHRNLSGRVPGRPRSVDVDGAAS